MYDFNRHIGATYKLLPKEFQLTYLEGRAYEVLSYCDVEVRTNPFGQRRYFLCPVVVTRVQDGRLKSFFCSFLRRDEIPVVKSEQFLIRLVKLALKNKQRERELARKTLVQ